MLRALGGRLAGHLQRWIPEPFVFAIILTLIVAAAALTLTDADINRVIDDWYRGFWILLEFGMQMALMLSTGFAIALSPPVARLIDRLALLARTPGAVYLLVMVVGGLFGLVSWGWGVLTAVFARELARRVDGIDYAYLAACVYLSGQTWTAGLSSSIPLLLNTEGNFLIETGVLGGTIAIGETLGSLLNACYVAVYFLCLPLLMWLMRPHDASARTMAELAETEHAERGISVAEEAASRNLTGTTPSDRLNNSTLLQLVIAGAALWYLVRRFTRNGFDLDLNVMIFVF
ncbi:MAG: TIGR00366 family protein, partial [Gammaproteobacteria bacterium]|nr:TIGR00366 family protein [Gammaproteobacteria bacterium]